MKTGSDTNASLPQKWHYEADVVVLGYGGSGIIAALTAYDAGASVLILEKAPIGGGVTKISDTNFISPSDVEGAFQYWYATIGAVTSEAVCRATAEEACQNVAWLEKMGIKCGKPVKHSEFPNMPGHSSMTGYHPSSSSAKNPPTPGAHGGVLFDALDEHRQNRGIEVLYNTPAMELIQDLETKEIRGVLADNQGTPIAVKAKRAVIICTGDFSNNQDMIRNYLRPYPMKFCGWKYSTGDGIVMALKVGAKLWHMNQICGHYCLDIPEYDSGYACFGGNPPSWIFVDKYGRRFANEDDRMSHNYWTYMADMDWDNLGFLRVPFYMVFDESRRAASPIARSFTSWLPIEMGGNVPWSEDNLAEIEKGWIRKGDTVEELAAAIGGYMNPSILKQTIDTWNAGCKAGVDAEFGRSANTSKPLVTPPYYAVTLMPGQSNTMGGPERNEQCQVMDHNNKPIPRLFEAGDCGGIFGHAYGAGGGNIGVLVMAHGRIAGRNAAAAEPWE
jgi:succinate dehydrogenase/fumarate reductase flavoprotein subunit